MKTIWMGMAFILVMSGSASLAESPPDMAAYATVAAGELAKNPATWWARAISFADRIESFPSGLSKKLGNGSSYRHMELAEAGVVWVPAAMANSFRQLEHGQRYSFSGTVNQTDERFYVVLDGCYIQSDEAGSGPWISAFAPPIVAPSAEPEREDPAPIQIAASRFDSAGTSGEAVVMPPSIDGQTPEAEQQAKLEAKEKKAAEKQARLEAKRHAKEEAAAAEAAARAERERQQAEALAQAQAEETAKAEAQRVADERQAELEAKEKAAAAEAAVRAEREHQQAEARAREEAEAQAQAIAAQAEADARRIQQEAERVAEEKRQAENAIREAQELERQIATERARRQAAEQQLAELEARQQAAESEVQAIETEKNAALERLRGEYAAQEAARAAERQAQLASQTAQQDEVLRITREMAVRGEDMAGEAARLLAEEEKSRQAVEQDIFRVENEIRALQAETSRVKFQQEAEMQAAVRAAELAAQVAAENAQREAELRTAQETARQGQLIAEEAATRLAAEEAARQAAEEQMSRIADELRGLEQGRESAAPATVVPAAPAATAADASGETARLEAEHAARAAAEERLARLTEEARILEKKLEEARRELQAVDAAP